MSRGFGIAQALLPPFWRATTMYRETVVFRSVRDNVSDAALLFRPDTVLELTSSDGDAVYQRDRDYTIDVEAGRIVRLPDSRIPILAGERAGVDGTLLHSWQSAITYVHDNLWTGYRATYAGDALPRVTRRLQRGESLTIAIMGDSISEGYDASGFHSLAPMQPAYPTLVAHSLEERFGSSVHLNNIAVAGSASSDGISEAPRLAGINPDLVIIAYGMNDATYADPDEFDRNISAIVDRVRADTKTAEIVLVAPMLPTDECDFVDATRFPQYRQVLSRLCGDGIALADLTTLWADLLQRKTAMDLSGNGLNHPNDFGHRLYAQVILAMLCP